MSSYPLCQFEFKGPGCGYKGKVVSCNKSYWVCKNIMHNTKNYGGFRLMKSVEAIPFPSSQDVDSVFKMGRLGMSMQEVSNAFKAFGMAIGSLGGIKEVNPMMGELPKVEEKEVETGGNYKRKVKRNECV